MADGNKLFDINRLSTGPVGSMNTALSPLMSQIGYSGDVYKPFMIEGESGQTNGGDLLSDDALKALQDSGLQLRQRYDSGTKSRFLEAYDPSGNQVFSKKYQTDTPMAQELAKGALFVGGAALGAAGLNNLLAGGSLFGGAASGASGAAGATGGGSLLGGSMPAITAPAGGSLFSGGGALGAGTATGSLAGGAASGAAGALTSVKEALFGASGYGSGMSGAATSAFDAVLSATGSTGLAASAGSAVNAMGSGGSWLSNAWGALTGGGAGGSGGGLLGGLFSGSGVMRDVLGLLGAGVEQFNIERMAEKNRDWQSKERQKDRDFELKKDADRRRRQAPVSNIFGRATVLSGDGNG